MGELRFTVHPLELLEVYAPFDQAYVTGHDLLPTSKQILVEKGQLICRHSVGQSATFFLPWPVEGFGRPMLRTATLLDRPQPYQLQVELARGKLNQVRSQLAEWQLAGLEPSPASDEALHQAMRHLVRAVAQQHDPATAASESDSALHYALIAAECLTRDYTRQALAWRHRQYPQLGTLLACSLGHSPLQRKWHRKLLSAFNSAVVPVNWKHIEPNEGEYCWDAYDRQVRWCQKYRLVTRGGPLLNFGPEGIPDWLWLWEGDFANLVSFVSDFVETVVSRYLGKIRVWVVTSGANSTDLLSLNEEQRLRLTVKILEVARQIDPDAQFVIRIDQPWGQYAAARSDQLSPLDFADALLRADLGLSGVDLEIAVGYQPGGVVPRDLMEFSRLLDRWAALGAPLQLTLGFPSSSNPDPQAKRKVLPAAGAWRRAWDEKAQAEWLGDIIRLALAKPPIQGIALTHFSDAEVHDWPHAGLLRADGTPKPAFEELVRIRREHLR
jgi:hypothetical protein